MKARLGKEVLSFFFFGAAPLRFATLSKQQNFQRVAYATSRPAGAMVARYHIELVAASTATFKGNRNTVRPKV